MIDGESMAAGMLGILRAGGTHVDGIRDPQFPCEVFRLGTPDTGGRCETDGHYVCDECVHRATCGGCGLRPSACECCCAAQADGGAHEPHCTAAETALRVWR